MNDGIRLDNCGQQKPKANANPAQIKDYDNRMDRLEVVNLLRHLEPRKRVKFLEWAVANSLMPNSGVPNAVGYSTYELRDKARHCDIADEQLTIDILRSLCYCATNMNFDFDGSIKILVEYVRGKELPPVPAPWPLFASSRKP